MSEPREMRGLAAAEIAAVVVLAVLPLPEAVPVALPLVAVASILRWVRGRSWGDVVHGGFEHAAIGALVGAAALGLAVLAGTPVIELLSQRAIEWSSFPIVRGNSSQLAVVALYVAITAVAAELALRGWIVERVLELSPGPAILPVLAGALAEALLTPGNLAARIGAGVFGAGLGWIYVAGGRSIVAPICARVVFSVGALFLEAMRVIG